MNKGASFAVAALTATIAPLAACANQQSSQPNTSPLTSSVPGAEKLTTQLKTADGSPVANATFEFANGYATVTVEAGPNQVLSPRFPRTANPLGRHMRGELRLRGNRLPGGESHGLSRQWRPDRVAGALRRLGETGHHQ